MNIVKRFIVIILFFTFHNLFSQEINIFILDASSKVDSGYVYNTYTSIGFNEVNIIESDINTSLDTGTYDVAFVAEGHYYDNTDAYWDGTFRGNKVADGLYTYKLNYNTRIVTETVHLFK
jgi:hypothetical protein